MLKLFIGFRDQWIWRFLNLKVFPELTLGILGNQGTLSTLKTSKTSVGLKCSNKSNRYKITAYRTIFPTGKADSFQK